MGATLSVIKLQTLIVPAVISLLLFLISTYVALPLWRRYRQRYSQYLPVDALSHQTAGVRHRIQGIFGQPWFLPSYWRRRFHQQLVVAAAEADSDDELGFESDDGEELTVVSAARRRDIEAAVGREGRPEDSRRLSRDLEEGFRDDSDDEDEDDRRLRS